MGEATAEAPTTPPSVDAAAADDDRRADVLAWMRDTGRGYRAASKKYGIARDKIKGWARAPAPAPAPDDHQAPPAPSSAAAVDQTREAFLGSSLAAALADLARLRGMARATTAVSVQTRTVVEIRAQLDEERCRLASLTGEPMEQMSEVELTAEIIAALRALPIHMLTPIIEAIAARYGKPAALLIEG